MSNESNSSTSVGFSGLLTIVFITLKLCGVIDWPWLWVLAPLWISVLVVVGITAVVVAVMIVKGDFQ